jgi:hypothetical protein
MMRIAELIDQTKVPISLEGLPLCHIAALILRLCVLCAELQYLEGAAACIRTKLECRVSCKNLPIIDRADGEAELSPVCINLESELGKRSVSHVCDLTAEETPMHDGVTNPNIPTLEAHTSSIATNQPAPTDNNGSHNEYDGVTGATNQNNANEGPNDGSNGGEEPGHTGGDSQHNTTSSGGSHDTPAPKVSRANRFGDADFPVPPAKGKTGGATSLTKYMPH